MIGLAQKVRPLHDLRAAKDLSVTLLGAIVSGIFVSASLACVVLSAPVPSVALAAESTAQSQSATSTSTRPVIESSNAIIEDSDGDVLFQTTSGSPVSMASTTKVMTATLALESGLSLDTTYTFSETAVNDESTTVGYQAGEVVTLRDMLYALLLYSAGDAANGIAELVGGSIDNFVTMMNSRASELGMTDTLYTTPTGYIDDDHTTPSDLVKLFRHAMGITQFRSIVGMKQVTLTVAGVQRTLTNTDWLLDTYPGMIGGKTGFTYGANYCFVGACQRGGVTLYFCVLGSDSEQSRATDATSLLNWGFSQYPEHSLCQSGSVVPVCGYRNAGYRYGRVIATDVIEGLTSRVDLSALTGKTTTYDNQGSFAMPGDTLGCVTWVDGSGTIIGSRQVVARRDAMLTQSYGTFVNSIFYQLAG
ncbi:MAG: D-alanyl-D-alanine carboxypeptidase family protein [Coriobacteriales bacterium]|jgi:D-alanyl-D-alanine carboxypeptidase (penicillin-binding protein 5/6)